MTRTCGYPIADQTEYQGQRWGILVPRAHQRQLLHPYNDYWMSTIKPRDIILNSYLNLSLWTKLAKPIRPERFLKDVAQRPSATVSKRLSYLECAPTEILNMVLRNHGLSKKDLVALAVSSDVLFLHVLYQVENDSWQAAAPWADRELACTSTYLTDLDESFEKDDLFYSTVNEPNGGPVSEDGVTPLARKINLAAIDQYEQVKEDADAHWQASLDEVMEDMATRGDLEITRLAQFREDILRIFASRYNSRCRYHICRNVPIQQLCRVNPSMGGRSGMRDRY